MVIFPDEPTEWIGFRSKQQSADELLLAEVIKEVMSTLRSRGVPRSHAAIEAYHATCDLVKQRSGASVQSPLAQVTTTLHVFCLAVSPISNPASSFPPIPDPPAMPEDREPWPVPEDVTLPKSRKHSRSHTRKKRERIAQKKEEDEPDAATILFRHNQLRTMPYPEYLQTPEWQMRRQEKLRNAQSRCQVCNGTIRLAVHHRTYTRRGYEKEQDLIVLCEDCHQLFHERMQKEENML